MAKTTYNKRKRRTSGAIDKWNFSVKFELSRNSKCMSNLVA